MWHSLKNNFGAIYCDFWQRIWIEELFSQNSLTHVGANAGLFSIYSPGGLEDTADKFPLLYFVKSLPLFKIQMEIFEIQTRFHRTVNADVLPDKPFCLLWVLIMQQPPASSLQGWYLSRSQLCHLSLIISASEPYKAITIYSCPCVSGVFSLSWKRGKIFGFEFILQRTRLYY